MPSGRKTGPKPGYKHSKAAREKMSQSKVGIARPDSTKEKISYTMSGGFKSEADRKAIATGRAYSDLEYKCAMRFLEMRAEYPGHEEFFDSNRTKLLYAMRDIRSESELRDIRRYIETTHIDEVPQACLQYQYDSSSIYAHEKTMVELMDAAAFLRKSFSTKDDFVLIH